MKKLLVLVVSVSILVSSMISVHASGPTLDDLIYESRRRARWAISSHCGSVKKQIADLDEALSINIELTRLKNSGKPISDKVLNKYIKRLNAIGVDFTTRI